MPGDLAIFRDEADQISHTAVVRAICDDGTVLVESKWSWMGVFLHRAGDSFYGESYTFYRSARTGHRLVATAPPGNRDASYDVVE